MMNDPNSNAPAPERPRKQIAVYKFMQQQKKLIADTFRQKKIVLADLSTFALHFLKAIHIHVKG